MVRDHELITAAGILEAALGREQRAEAEPGVDDGSARVGADQVEDLIATIFAAAFGVDRLSRRASFAALGGDSLMAISILSRIWRAFDVKLTLRALVPDGSIATVAADVRQIKLEGAPAVPPVTARGAVGRERASENQAAIWFLEDGEGVGPLHNIPLALRLRGRLDRSALRNSLESLVRRHEALRCRFSLENGRLVQEPVAEATIELPLVDVSESSAPGTSALSLGDDHIREPIDLSDPPLIRPLLIRLAAGDHLLVLVVHHIVADAWSLKLVLRELADGYDAAVEPDPAPVAPGFLDFVAWQREMLDGEEGKRLAWSWRQALRGLDPAPLPVDFPRPAARSYAGQVVPVELGAQTVEDLTKVAGDQGITLYMLLLSAYSIAVAGRLGLGEIVVGSPVANREQESIEEVVGNVANMVPMRIGLEGDPTLRELFARTRETALAAYERQAMPFSRLVRELAPPRDHARNPIFQTGLVLNDMTPAPIGTLDTVAVILHTGTAKLDLSCYLEKSRDGGLVGYLEYATALFSTATVEHIRTTMLGTLDVITSYVDHSLSELWDRIGAGDDPDPWRRGGRDG